MRKHIRSIGLLSIGLCLGTLIGYVLRGEGKSALTTVASYEPRIRYAPIDTFLQEARTGRIVLGGSLNSDLGVAGQLIVEERNFDYRP